MAAARDLGSRASCVWVRVPHPLPQGAECSGIKTLLPGRQKQKHRIYENALIGELANKAGNKSNLLWLRSTEVVHFLGKEEVSGSNLLGASTIITMKHRWFCSVVE